MNQLFEAVPGLEDVVMAKPFSTVSKPHVNTNVYEDPSDIPNNAGGNMMEF